MAQDVVDANIECIVIDDCSPDNSMAIVQEVISKYKGPIRFVILRHEINHGLSAARNNGIMQACGDYVMFIDSDDYLLRGSIQYFLDNIILFPEVDMLMGNVKDCKSGKTMITQIKEPWLIDDPDIFFSRMLHHQIYLYAWNKLIKRQMLLDHRILFEEGILYEDQCWSYQLFSEILSVLLLPRVTYVYENNKNSIVNTSFTSGKADKVVWSYTISINKMMRTPPFPSRYRQNMTPHYLLFMLHHMMNGVDVMSRFPISSDVAKGFRNLKKALFCRSLRYGRLLISFFCLLMFSPFSKLQKLRFFRHHYYDIESIVNRLSYLTDFLHNKERL